MNENEPISHGDADVNLMIFHARVACGAPFLEDPDDLVKARSFGTSILKKGVKKDFSILPEGELA